MRGMHRRKIDRHILPAINYGLDTVRFPAPVLSTSRRRLTATVTRHPMSNQECK
jgi:acyl dehydratase